MPILTKPSVTRAKPASFSLDKSLLVGLISDAYYKDTANWKSIVLQYVSSVGKQKSKVLFDASQATPTGEFLVSIKARHFFEVEAIIVYDFDGGHYLIPRSSLTASEFDLSTLFTKVRDFSSPSSILSYEKMTGITISNNQLVWVGGETDYFLKDEAGSGLDGLVAGRNYKVKITVDSKTFTSGNNMNVGLGNEWKVVSQSAFGVGVLEFTFNNFQPLTNLIYGANRFAMYHSGAGTFEIKISKIEIIEL